MSLGVLTFCPNTNWNVKIDTVNMNSFIFILCCRCIVPNGCGLGQGGLGACKRTVAKQRYLEERTFQTLCTHLGLTRCYRPYRIPQTSPSFLRAWPWLVVPPTISRHNLQAKPDYSIKNLFRDRAFPPVVRSKPTNGIQYRLPGIWYCSQSAGFLLTSTSRFDFLLFQNKFWRLHSKRLGLREEKPDNFWSY